MNKKLTFFTSVLSVCIFFSGCFAGLDRYQPESPAEESVIKVVMEHERTWNENDASGFLETFHESAKIELGVAKTLFPLEISIHLFPPNYFLFK